MTTISEISTYAAAHKPKKSKAAAWTALQAVIVGDVTHAHLATLYRYLGGGRTATLMSLNPDKVRKI